MALVLVVDDHTVTLRVLSHQLKREGHQVIVAENGKLALEKLQSSQTPIDLVIMDLTMPEMDGLTLVSILNQDPRYQALPKIILTASWQDCDRQAARELGVNVFLNKPVSSWELSESIRSLLSPGSS